MWQVRNMRRSTYILKALPTFDQDIRFASVRQTQEDFTIQADSTSRAATYIARHFKVIGDFTRTKKPALLRGLP
ncbi:MAG: hypothetical protein ACI9HK_000947 [Pirellulaceae bacterium]|jgi:hypothetical protein